MAHRSLIGAIIACGVVGCVRYVEAPPANPVRALADPVLLESVSTVDRHGDYQSVRFRLHVRAPSDSTIALVLAPARALRLDSAATPRPVIEFGSAGTSGFGALVRLQPRLHPDRAADTTGVLFVGSGARDTTVTILADVGALIPQSFTLRVNWYRLSRRDSLAAPLLESRERDAHVEDVVWPLNLAVAAAAIITFFVVTTR